MEKRPPPEAISEALKHPNGWVYEVDEVYKDKVDVPPQAVKGAWKVNQDGIIIGNFIPNPNYVDQKVG
ncbi:MAG: hypothetical protein ABIP10_10710 [Ferruginibacter sp.]